MAVIPDHFRSALHGVADQIFQAGFEAGIAVGAERMRVAILSAAQSPRDVLAQSSAAAAPQTGISTDPVSSNGGRAPRGSVRAAIIAALKAAPEGLNEIDIGVAAQRIDPAMSPRSVGGELRRLRNRLYRIDRGRWFLIAQGSDKETAGPEGPAATLATEKEAPDARETAIAA